MKNRYVIIGTRKFDTGHDGSKMTLVEWLGCPQLNSARDRGIFHQSQKKAMTWRPKPQSRA